MAKKLLSIANILRSCLDTNSNILVLQIQLLTVFCQYFLPDNFRTDAMFSQVKTITIEWHGSSFQHLKKGFGDD